MRTMDTNLLKPLGPNGTGPWRMGEDKLLRVRSGNHLIRTEDKAKEMLDIYRTCAAVAHTPQGHEVVRLGDGFGVVVDYVGGLGLGIHVVLGSYSPSEAGRDMGKLLHGLHGSRVGVGRNWNATFRGWASALAPFLPAEIGGRLMELVDAVPEHNCLLHGDFHVGNVAVRDGRLALIDMECVGFGHPVFDLAVARSRMLRNARSEAVGLGIDAQVAERVTCEMWNSMMEGYFEGADKPELAELDRRICVLSEVEDCCFNYGIGHAGPAGPDERTKARIVRCACLLAELLPQLDRLDF